MAQAKTQFDNLLAKQEGNEQKAVVAAEAAWFVKNIEVATLWKHIGDVKGLTALDLGSGFGKHTRKLLECGATSVTGVDSSEKMIEKASASETDSPSGAKFVLSDVNTYTHPEPVDFVLANKVLHFSKDKEALRAMISSFHRNLKSGGKLVGIACVLYPDGRPLPMPLDNLKINYPEIYPLPDGVLVPVDIIPMGFTVTCWYYYDETMTSILKEVGFKDIKWHPLEILTDEQFEAREKFEKALPDIILRVLTAVKE